jgi:hypothetical protein
MQHYTFKGRPCYRHVTGLKDVVSPTPFTEALQYAGPVNHRKNASLESTIETLIPAQHSNSAKPPH